jgi:hypothetical protein
MDDNDPKAVLHRYLQAARDALLWKLDGLSEYDLRRPLVPTATNLLGLVKHLASVESGYFADTFGRPTAEHFPWYADDAEANEDMWATPDESSADIIALYRRVWVESDAAIAELDLDAPGKVPWWPEGQDDVTLHHILVRMVAETNRHLGHADIVRELIDGAVGMRQDTANLPDSDADWWRSYHDRVEAAAASFAVQRAADPAD